MRHAKASPDTPPPPGRRAARADRDRDRDVVASARPAAQAADDDQGRADHEGRHESVLREDEGGRDRGRRRSSAPSCIYAAGKSSSDNASQIAAIENMVTAGAKGILITVADAKAENAAIAKARKAGVLVIALDSPTDPTTRRRRAVRDEQLQRRRPDREVRARGDEGQDGDDRDARRARGLVGRRAPSQRLPEGLRDQGQRQADRLRRERRGQTARSQTAMENCLQKNPDIDVVYTINEPSAAGAWTALKNAGKSKSGVTIVSVDGGCAGVRNVKAGSSTRPRSSTRC